MKEGLLTLQSAEMLPRRAFRVAVRVAGGDREAIQQPQPVFQAFGRRRLPILLRQHRPEPGEGMAPGLLAQGQIQPLQRLLHRLMSRKTGPFMPGGLHRLLRLLQIPQGLIHPVRRSIGQGQHG
jgi:hypothetical protein